MGLTIKLDERALHKYLDRSIKSWPDAAAGALAEVGRSVFDESQREVPVGATKRLKSEVSLSVAPHTVLIAYLAPYARIVHFRKARHAIGKRRFLSTPLGKGRRLLPHVIVQAIQNAMDTTPKT